MSAPEEMQFRSQTGDTNFDSIVFTARPSAEIIGTVAGGVNVVLHLGVATSTDVAKSSGCLDVDLLAMNMSTGGQIARRCDGKTIRRTQRRGEIGFLPAGMEAELEFPVSYSAVALLFPRGVLMDAAETLGPVEFEPLHYEPHPRLAQLVDIAVGEARSPGFASDLVLDGVIHAIAALLARVDGLTHAAEAERIHLSPVRLARVIDYVDANLHREITLSELAGVAQLSPFHFSRVFKRATGDAPYHFVCMRRLDRASQLLAEGTMPLAELALACGFSSQAHFTAAFSKFRGISPGRFRRSLSRNSDNDAAIEQVWHNNVKH